MTNKTKTILCVCALTASAFAWNATADDVPEGYYHLENEGPVLVVPTEGAYGILDNVKDSSTLIGYGAVEYNGQHYDLYRAKGAWLGVERGSETTYTAIQNEDVLQFSIERNNTENGFIFGTYTVDKDGNILLTKTLGTVTQKGWVGVTEMKDESGNLIMDDNGNPKTLQKIAIDPASPDYDYNVESVYSDAFNARDLVGVWMQELDVNGNPTGITYYSQNSLTVSENKGSLPDLHGKDPLFTQGLLDGGSGPDALLYFDDGILDQGSPDYNIPANPGWGWPGEETTAFVKIHITGAAPGYAGKVGPKMGGPLPGVWATIALAGAASAYLKRRRKENK